jgi:hypothetical protein
MSNLGPRRMGSHHTRGGIPSKKEGVQRIKEIGKGNRQGKLARGAKGELRHDLVLLIYACVNDSCMNAANKRIVFRL